LTAYEYFLRGHDYYYHYSKQDNETAIELFKKALELDPSYALAWAMLMASGLASIPSKFPGWTQP
jgi:protein kinase/serine/threonine-protein kinase